MPRQRYNIVATGLKAKIVMQTAIRKMGNSSGVIIPKAILTELKMTAGDAVELRAEGGKVLIEPIRKKPREGWAEDAKRIAAEDVIDTEWLEFPNDADDTLVW
jgi:antitoxin MazE